MSSDRLYYTDAYLIEFDAVVRDVTKRGEQWLVTLDRSAFYPTSGGQPADTGSLGEGKVLDVIDQEDGSIGHVVDRDLEKNSRVRGHIDWDRRFDHMQQHTGQHVLSAALEKEVGAKTVSFHLGTKTSTIDLDKELTPQQLAQAEDTANKVLWDDREVCVKFMTAHEAAKLPLRKDPTREGDLRIIDITDFDLSACGGTHVRRTGAIGMIAIVGAERFKGGLRVEFVCGQRALKTHRRLREVVGAGVRSLSVLPDELPAAIEKLQSANRAQQKDSETLREQLAGYEAAALSAKGERVGDVTLVAQALSGWDATGLKKLASAITQKPGMVAVLITSESPSLVVVARSQELSLDAGVVLRTLLDKFGGKGGGKGAMAQGGGLNGSSAEILAAARQAL